MELQSPPFVSIGLLDLFLEFPSCCHVVAVAFLPHEFLSVGPNVSPGYINPGYLIRGRPVTVWHPPQLSSVQNPQLVDDGIVPM